MTVMIGALPIEIDHNKPINEISYNINGPGIVRGATFVAKPKLVMTRGEPEFDEQLVIFIETSPSLPQRRRTFVVVPSGKPIDAPEGRRLAFAATAISPAGRIAHVFELKTTD